jgi:hypothetical protein
MADSVDGDPLGGETANQACPYKDWRRRAPPNGQRRRRGRPGRRGTGGQRRWHRRAGPAAREASALPTRAASPRSARPANPRRAQDRRLTATATQAGSSQVGTGSNPWMAWANSWHGDELNNE